MVEDIIMPEERELVLATVTKITPHGVYVSLDEYGGLSGFLHISEISTGWVRNIERHASIGEKKVLRVIRVNKARKEIDLSLRQVTDEEKREKLISVKREEKARGIFDSVRAKANISEEEDLRIRETLLNEYDGLYDVLEDLVRQGASAIADLSLPEHYVKVLEEAAKEKIAIPTVEVEAYLEVSSNASDGVDVVKGALLNVEGDRGKGAKVKVEYLGAPRYKMTVTAENYKIAERVLDSSLQLVKKAIEKRGGSFSFSREPPRRKKGE